MIIPTTFCRALWLWLAFCYLRQNSFNLSFIACFFLFSFFLHLHLKHKRIQQTSAEWPSIQERSDLNENGWILFTWKHKHWETLLTFLLYNSMSCLFCSLAQYSAAVWPCASLNDGSPPKVLARIVPKYQLAINSSERRGLKDNWG